MIIIDSDVLIEILDRKSLKGDQALKQITESKEEVATTVISLHEVLYGLHKYGKPIKELLLLPILSYTKKDAVLASKIELEVEKKGKIAQVAEDAEETDSKLDITLKELFLFLQSKYPDVIKENLDDVIKEIIEQEQSERESENNESEEEQQH